MRRKERDFSAYTYMPAAWAFGSLGLIVLIGFGLHAADGGILLLEIVSIAAAVMFIPLVLEGYRYLRGHHSEDLNEP